MMGGGGGGGVCSDNIRYKEGENLIIKGNNLIVLYSILRRFEQKIKCIYIDPPYNTGNDSFNYNDSFNHSTWLTFMKNRLEVAKRLLRSDGVIFVQCDDNEQAYLKVLMDEVMGRENFVSTIVWLKGNAQNDAKTIQRNQEYIICYAKNIEVKSINKVLREENQEVYRDEKTNQYYYEGAGLTVGSEGGELINRPNLGYSFYFNENTKDIKPVMDYDPKDVNKKMTEKTLYKDVKELIDLGYIPVRPPIKDLVIKCWTWSIEKSIAEINRIIIKKGKGGYSVLRKEWIKAKDVFKNENGKLFARLKKENPPKSFIDFVGSGVGTSENKYLFKAKTFSSPKPEKLLQHILHISTRPCDIVLDFFMGSATTCAVAHKMGRQYIGIEQMDYINTISLPRLIKVLEGEEGGISKAVNWKGGGAFIYCELKENAYALIDAVQSANEEGIEKIKETIFSDERIVPYITKEELKNAESDFENLSLQEKKDILLKLINKNMLYVNYSDIDDESVILNENDKAFNRSFYEEECN